MVSVKCENDKFLIKGTFDMGIAGVFENKEYGEGNIEFCYSVRDLERAIDRDMELWDGMKATFANVPHDSVSWAKVLEKEFNETEAKVQKNIKQINDYILYRLITQFLDVEQPFWEVEEAVLPEFADMDTKGIYKNLYDNKIWDTMDELYREYEEAPNDGSLHKTDVEALARRLFPMFHLDGLIATIVPDRLSLGGSIGVQFYDGWEQEFFCHAMAEFDEKLALIAWDNF